MAHIVSMLGSKGGSGKTTLSHMLCYGLGLLGHRAAFVMTDACRTPPVQGTLPYVFADARSSGAREKIISTLRARENWFGIIDGGANQVTTDSKIHDNSDLILLPFRDSHEDMRVVCHDMERLPSALALPSQWPTNPWQYQASVRLLESFPEELKSRVLAPVFSISSSKLLLQEGLAERFPTPLNNACRAIARYMQGILEHGHTAIPPEHTALGATKRIQHVIATRKTQEAARV